MLVGFVLTVLPPQSAPGPSQGSTSRDLLPSKKLIALTFDDGPRPYVLVGRKLPASPQIPGLLGLLDRERITATFFVMGWRLAEGANEFCRQTDVGINCRQAAEEEHRRGHEIENHTYGHGDFYRMKKRYGEEWILNDIERASHIIQSVTGVRPRYVRPPNWDIWDDLRTKIESRGYHVMTKTLGPLALRDVDSGDYSYRSQDSNGSAQHSLHDDVLRRIEQRERRGVYAHILVFHELPLSVEVLSGLIPELKRRGYAFAPLRTYMETVSAGLK
jgi:peptidoglycan/xylan/chitin deacetylase (PgdA/CDA1 family)